MSLKTKIRQMAYYVPEWWEEDCTPFHYPHHFHTTVTFQGRETVLEWRGCEMLDFQHYDKPIKVECRDCKGTLDITE